MTDFPTLLYIQLVKSLPFLTPEARKRYLFRVETTRIDHHREYPWPPPRAPDTHSNCIQYNTDIIIGNMSLMFYQVLSRLAAIKETVCTMSRKFIKM